MTEEVIVFPDAVAVTVAYLTAALDAADTTTHVGSRVPDDRGTFVLVSLIDAERTSIVVERSTLRVECWVEEGALSQENAQDLGQLCHGLLTAMAGTTQAGARIYKVADVAGAGLADRPDPLTGQARYTFSVLISMRGGATLDPDTVVTVPDWFHGTQGPEGPPGPQGPPGDAVSGASFIFEQDVPATVWTVVHNLGFFPSVTTVDTINREFEGAVEYVDDNSLTVTFAVAVTGKALLS